MKFTHLLNVILLASSLTVFTSCGGKSKGGSSDSGTSPVVDSGKKPVTEENKQPGTTVAEFDCKELWKNYLKSNPKGMITEYEVKSEYKLINSTSLTKPVITKQKNEIVESSDTQVVTKKTVSTGANDFVTTDTRKSSEMIEKCEEQKKQGLPVNMGSINQGVTTEVEKEEFITVVAGSFNCNYKKVKIDSPNNGGNSTYESWTAKELPASLMVKSILKNQSTVNNQSFNSTTTSELIYYVIP